MIATASLAVLVANFVITGRDVPGGLLSILGTIFGAVFATDTILKWRNNTNSNASTGSSTPEASSINEEVKP